jgi:predicted DNA-binding WGR domain protein
LLSKVLETPVVHHFQRCSPSENMARFYRVEVRRTLFGEWAVVRNWGRIGTYGREKFETHPTREAARASLEHCRLAKSRRGYIAVEEPG